MKGELWLTVLENRVHRKIFGTARKRETGCWKIRRLIIKTPYQISFWLANHTRLTGRGMWPGL
jgi:hypothetical protein